MHHLKDDNGTLITDRVEIANTLGAAIEKSSSSNNYSEEFQSIKALNILKVLSRTEWGTDQTTLLKLYRALVRSKLDYGGIVSGSSSKTAVHNQGLRLSLGAFRSSPVESLYVEAHEPPLEIGREKLAL